jgi:molybdopterin synthase sulfur carrier subunit
MIEVRFFGRVREILGCDALQLDYADDIADLDALTAMLCRERGPRWSEILAEPNLIRAVNHSVIEGNKTLVDGDEVAYFPPVTGG